MQRPHFFRRRLRVSKLTTTLIFCVLFLIFLLLWSESENGRSNKHSVTELRSFADQMNSARLNNAFQYFRSLNASRSQRFYEENLAKYDLDLVISIPTVRRPTRPGLVEMGYLIQTAAMFDRLLKTDEKFGGKMMFICNTDNMPKEHSEATLLQDYLPSIQLYGNSTSKAVPLVSNIFHYHKNYGNKYSKETFDYMFCLQTALLYKSKYILMAEDDALPRKELLPVLYQLLWRQHELVSTGKAIKRKPFFLIKLYYPERWLGYAYEFPRIIELLGIGAFGWGLFALLFSFLWKRTYCETLTVATLGGACIVLLALLMGRQKVMELRRLSSHLYFVRPAPDCCTPAVLYRAENVSKFLRYLSQGTYDSTRPLDIAMAEYFRAVSESSLYVEPNLFRHIGMYSSLGKSPKSPEYFLFQ
ncbi:unnamed protein product [Acanthosepion pharaonis]|uniref:Transmembrane protein n=1 Tax=Acanthosepion pharaonis TaxID=158019 RepID=A0A812EI41_ACAPH|nr:unnamed protein product [Sepia pharaonis]